MYGLRAHILSVSLLFLVISSSFGQGSKRSGNGTRVHFGPVVGFYRINLHHAIQPTQKVSLAAGFRREQRVDRDYKTYLQVGVEYFLHGVNFRSYLFNPDSLKIYDKSFGFRYSLTLHELNLPIQLKYLFKREDNSLFSPYATVAYHFRYLLPAGLRIYENGNLVRSDSPEMQFKTPFLNSRMNAFVSAGLGWQKNNLTASKGSFFAEVNFRYGFSPYYFETDYAASSLFINSTHLSLQLGMKF